jgi:hypothetical protein
MNNSSSVFLLWTNMRRGRKNDWGNVTALYILYTFVK